MLCFLQKQQNMYSVSSEEEEEDQPQDATRLHPPTPKKAKQRFRSFAELVATARDTAAMQSEVITCYHCTSSSMQYFCQPNILFGVVHFLVPWSWKYVHLHCFIVCWQIESLKRTVQEQQQQLQLQQPQPLPQETNPPQEPAASALQPPSSALQPPSSALQPPSSALQPPSLAPSPADERQALASWISARMDKVPAHRWDQFVIRSTQFMTTFTRCDTQASASQSGQDV